MLSIITQTCGVPTLNHEKYTYISFYILSKDKAIVKGKMVIFSLAPPYLCFSLFLLWNAFLCKHVMPSSRTSSFALLCINSFFYFWINSAQQGFGWFLQFASYIYTGCIRMWDEVLYRDTISLTQRFTRSLYALIFQLISKFQKNMARI